jgi:hypothetical protein
MDIAWRIPASGNDGREYVIEAHRRTRRSVALTRGAQQVPILPKLFTSDGRAVTPIADGKYQILGTSIILTPLKRPPA